MAETAPIAEPPPRSKTFRRVVLIFVLVVLLASALYVLYFTAWGARLRADPAALGTEFRDWVDSHLWIAPLVFVAIYVITSVCLLPVWWLQILGGAGFGLLMGVVWSLTGATLGALASFGMSRGLLAEWVQTKFEVRHAKLRELDEKLGHNGLMVVMAARLTHVIPFGVSNYVFGMTRINWVEVMLGTVMGNVPMIAFYTATGAGWHPWKDWRFILGLALLNVLLLVPIAIRYWKPAAFKKLGVE